jgi:hypothetical protein
LQIYPLKSIEKQTSKEKHELMKFMIKSLLQRMLKGFLRMKGILSQSQSQEVRKKLIS